MGRKPDPKPRQDVTTTVRKDLLDALNEALKRPDFPWSTIGRFIDSQIEAALKKHKPPPKRPR